MSTYLSFRFTSSLVTPGVYSGHYDTLEDWIFKKKWIQKEIDGVNHYAKPILGVNPRGQERRSSVVVDAAEEIVGWNSKSVVGGMRNRDVLLSVRRLQITSTHLP